MGALKEFVVVTLLAVFICSVVPVGVLYAIIHM